MVSLESGRRSILITGASGFLGSALARDLSAKGHSLRRIGRGAGTDVRWDPISGSPAGTAVIHLAGEPIAQRWTAARRQAIRESRVEGTRRLAEACAALPIRPEVFVSASAVGIYGSRGDEILDETSAAGDDFLAEIGRAWEAATGPARDAGIRVVKIRTGLVLSPDGGALGKMLLPFKLGVGGRIGAGTQWMSWISREDWVRAVAFILERPGISGAVNLAGPEPVTNATFASTLGRILRRPAVMPVPAFAVRALFGEMAEGTILASQRVLPKVLERAGFQFAHPTLSTALRAELGLA